jgi:DNA-binding protein
VEVVGVVQVQDLVLDMVRVLVEEADQAEVKATARAMAMVKVLVAKMATKNMPPMVP